MCNFDVLGFFHTKPRDWLGERLRNDLFCVEWDVKPKLKLKTALRSQCLKSSNSSSTKAVTVRWRSLCIGQQHLALNKKGCTELCSGLAGFINVDCHCYLIY